MIHNWCLFSFVFVLLCFTAWKVTIIIFNINNVLFLQFGELEFKKKIPDDNCNWMLIRNIHWSYKYHILQIAYSSKGIIICESNHPVNINMYTKRWKQFNPTNKGHFTEAVTICCTSVAINQITDELNIQNKVFSLPI